MKPAVLESRLVRKLASGARIVVDEGAACFLVGGPRKTRSRVPGEAVRALLARGTIEPQGESAFVLSPAGRAAARRLILDQGDLAAQHQRRSRQVREVDGERRAVTVDLAESPLGWLRARKGRDGRALIGEAAFAAGERLRADFTRGNIMPSLGVNWSAIGVGAGRTAGGAGGRDLSEAALAARLRVERAIRALGPELAGTVVDFCCYLKGIEEIERERNWPKRSAKLVLQLGLSALARHYGLAERATGPER